MQPRVYLIAKTELTGGLSDYLDSINQETWLADKNQDGETLIEAAGRMCYRSWSPYDPNNKTGTNPNVTRVRQESAEYIRNILHSGHGSVLEHCSCTFLAQNVSRVFTHELVRHRAGAAYSQESMRYVRLDEIPFWLPECVDQDPEARGIFERAIGYLQDVQKALALHFGIDEQRDFKIKKQLTSLFRRLAPDGVATNIIFTLNLRALRHVIALRTATAAEEEIRIVFQAVAELAKTNFPLVFQDMARQEDGSYTFEYPKV